MDIAILTSSRADYGFYKPLLAYPDKGNIRFHLVVFGTHLSKQHGYTVTAIEADGFEIAERIPTVIHGDSPADIAKTIGDVHIQFADFWARHSFDYILCLGDRYEMYAAVSAAVPFNLPVIHLSGGEETTGAIDNYYRHALSLMAKIHFTNTQQNATKVAQLLGHQQHVYHVGSLAIDNIINTPLYSAPEFKQQFSFDLESPFILFTFHPETIHFERNQYYIDQIAQFLAQTAFAILATMPNTDTCGSIIREKLLTLKTQNPHLYIVESLGSKGYYTALKYCYCVLGNSSSGIVEAASFGKYSINLGNRQTGREKSHNVIDCNIMADDMMATLQSLPSLPTLTNSNIYGDGHAAERIINILNNLFAGKTKFNHHHQLF